MFNVAPQRLCSLLLVNRTFPRSMNAPMVKFSFRLRNYWLEFGIYPILGFLPYFIARILKLVEKQIYLIFVSRLSGCVCKVKKWIKLCNLNSSLTQRELDADISLSLTSLSSASGLFQMWTSVLKKATAARVVPTQRGGSSAGAFRATSFDLTSAAAKLWVKTAALYFNLDMWPQRVAEVWPPIKARLHSVYICFSSNCIHSPAPGSWTQNVVGSFGGSGLDLDVLWR